MNEEEKKAIEDLKRLKKGIEILNLITSEKDTTDIKAIDTIINSLEKRQEEIEVLTLDLEEMTKSNKHKEENWVHKNILNSYVSKDKIRKKLNYFENSFDYDDDGTSYELVMKVLDELLEEE